MATSDDSALTHTAPRRHTLIPSPTVPRLNPPKRLLLGPGPSNAHPRVYQALSVPQVGHLDAYFLDLMEDTKKLLRYVWQTENSFTIPVSGTGSAAMEAAVCNSIIPGEVMLVGCNGYFGERLCDMGSRYDADIRRVETDWGKAFTLAELTAAMERHKPQVLALVHAETSTGVCQDLTGVGDLCRKHDCLLLIDTVTSIGGLPVLIDEWKVDIAYAGTQKCLACPPGVAPLTLGPRATDKLSTRSGKLKVKNWYLDLTMIQKYIVTDGSRSYHHTAPISMVYALHEALQLVAEETLPVCWRRHRDTARMFWDGLGGLGLECLVPEKDRLPSLTTVKIPAGVDGGKVVKHLLTKYGIEIGGGLGALKGHVWRIGLMGYNSRPENAALVLTALQDALAAQGYRARSRL